MDGTARDGGTLHGRFLSVRTSGVDGRHLHELIHEAVCGNVHRFCLAFLVHRCIGERQDLWKSGTTYGRLALARACDRRNLFGWNRPVPLPVPPAAEDFRRKKG